MEEQENKNSVLVRASRFISGMFTPFLIPFIAFLILFLFTYLSIMPLRYKLIILGIVYSFTVLLPVFVIYLYSKIHKFPMRQLSERKRRYIPYLLTLTSYGFCALMMYRLHIPNYMTGIIIASLITIALFTLTNFFSKLSVHAGGMGVVVGCIVSFGAIFNYNPVSWLCLAILLTGVVGTARMIVGQHTLSEILAGFTVGLVCSIYVLHPVFRFFLIY